MGKAVLISIQPKWCEMIASGKKTVEVRKTRPKLETPFKCYIYCTNKRPFLVWGDVFRGDWETEFTHLSGYGRKEAEKIWDVFNGKVMGEFVCDAIFAVEQNREIHNELPGSPVETWYEWNDAPDGFEDTEDIEKASCLSFDEIKNYIGASGYFWHISDLEIYDTPKLLSEFIKPCENDLYCEVCAMYSEFTEQCGNKALRLSHPPQSWCYVEELPKM